MDGLEPSLYPSSPDYVPLHSGTHFKYNEAGGGIGFNKGLVWINQAGTADDIIGRTQFIARISMPNKRGQKYFGAEVQFGFGYKYDSRPTFLHANELLSLSPFGRSAIKSLQNIKSVRNNFKIGAGFSTAFSEHTIAVFGGVTGGLSANVLSEEIKFSLSISKGEFNRITEIKGVSSLSPWRLIPEDYFSGEWKQGENVVGQFSYLQVRNADGEWIDTGIQMYSPEGTEIWFSEEYYDEALKVKNAYDWHKYYRENQEEIDSYLNPLDKY